MQDHVIPTYAQASSGFRVTIPAMIVDWVRRATYAEIGLAAEKLDSAAFASDREAHPEWFLGPAANLRESYALLDRIDWSKTVPPLAVQIELRDYDWALLRALEGALEFADEEVADHVGEDVEHAAQLLHRQQEDRERQRVSEPSGMLTVSQLAQHLNRAWVYEHADELGAIRLGDGPKARLRFDLHTAKTALGRRSPVTIGD